MNTIAAQIKVINEKLQQLLKKNILLIKENEILTAQLTSFKEKEQDYKTTIDKLNQKLNIQQAVNGNIDKESKKDLEKRINQFLKDLDKSIAILSE